MEMAEVFLKSEESLAWVSWLRGLFHSPGCFLFLGSKRNPGYISNVFTFLPHPGQLHFLVLSPIPGFSARMDPPKYALLPISPSSAPSGLLRAPGLDSFNWTMGCQGTSIK